MLKVTAYSRAFAVGFAHATLTHLFRFYMLYEGVLSPSLNVLRTIMPKANNRCRPSVVPHEARVKLAYYIRSVLNFTHITR